MSLYLRLGYDRMSTVIQLNFDYEQNAKLMFIVTEPRLFQTLGD